MIIAKKIADQGYLIKPISNTLIFGDAETMSEMSRKISDKLYREISFIKSFVVPKIELLSTTYQENISSLDKTPDSVMDVVVLKDYDLIENLKDAGILNIKGNGELNPTSISIPPVNLEEVRSHFVAPTTDVNVDIKPILDVRTNEELLALWEKYFTDFNKTNKLAANLKYFNYAHIEDIQLLYVLCRNFEDELPITVVSGKDRAGTDLMVIKEFLLKCMLSYSDYNAKYLSSGVLVHKVVKKDTVSTVYVVENAYVEFLSKSAHGNDTLSGYVSQLEENATTMATLESILENDFKYYNLEVSRIKTEKLSEVSRTKKLLEAMYIQSANSVIEHLAGSDVLEKVSTAVVTDHIKRLLSYPEVKQVKMYRPKEMSYLIVGSLYPTIKSFLDDMIEVSISNPGMNANETALYASINKVTNLIAEQYELNKQVAYKG